MRKQTVSEWCHKMQTAKNLKRLECWSVLDA